MKKNLLFAIALLCAACFTTSTAFGQACVVDSQYTVPGIFPSDTLPDMEVGMPVADVVQFVFPSDTNFMGFQLDFDSFVVSNVSQIPANLMWECNNNHPTCVYVTQPPALTRGCVSISGTPAAQSTAYPAYDSIVVTGTAWVTVPFVGPVPIAQDIPVYYRIDGGTSIEGMAGQIGLEIFPNPTYGGARVSYTLPSPGNVNIVVFDMYGKEVSTVQQGVQNAGRYELPVSLNEGLASGFYFVRFDLNDGEFTETKKLMTLD